jgi:FixJ family two-component response regulator
MNLTERERVILQMSKQGLSDYRIARKTGMYPQSVTRSRKNALRKLSNAVIELNWALKIGIRFFTSEQERVSEITITFSFFL